MRYVVLANPAAARGLDVSDRGGGMRWARLADKMVIWDASGGDSDVLEWMGRSALEIARVSDGETDGQLYLVIQVGRSFQDAAPSAKVVVDHGRYLVVDIAPDALGQIVDRDELCWAVRPLPADTVILDTVTPAARSALPWIRTLVDALSRTTYEASLRRLATFPTRHSLSSHFVAAAQWATAELQSLGYRVQTVPITVQGGGSFNVVADLAGRASGPRGLVLATAHLDSINLAGGPTAPAPGADDNASGSAGVLEMARVLAAHPAAHDLRLILFGGEEEGLHGSNQYVAALPASERARIRAVVNMDMIATLNTPRLTVLLEGAAVSQALMTDLATAAATYTSLTVQTSLNPFASDHVPFIKALLPAVLTIEGTDSANGNIHTANDTLAHINYELALEILRMNVATSAVHLGIETPAVHSG